jgi:excisionase family DNA binding protein
MDTNDPDGDRRKKKRRHDSLAYSVDEAADLIGVSRRTLYELIAERRLVSLKLRGRRLITRSALERLLTESELIGVPSRRR